MKKIFTFIWLLLVVVTVSAQENYKGVNKEDSVRTYRGGKTYEVKHYAQKAAWGKKPQNVILMIGDGMGVAQVFAALTANGGHLFLENFKYTGFSLTQSADNYVTDSAAGGTALACGTKTYNAAIGVNKDTVAVPSMREKAEKKGMATGVVSTSAITHATPASFVAHQPNRGMYEEIAGDFLKTNIDVFIGGGYKHFTKRKDGRDLTVDLKAKGYQVLRNIEDIEKVKTGKLAGLTAPTHNGRISERGDLLPRATQTALTILDNTKKNFFLMVEGSEIDWGSHQNDANYIMEEMFDFDQAIGKVLEFAAQDGKTLVIVTADHETGGMSVNGGDISKRIVEAGFSTGDHTATMVPVFAFGPGAETLTGIMANAELSQKIMKLMGL